MYDLGRDKCLDKGRDGDEGHDREDVAVVERDVGDGRREVGGGVPRDDEAQERGDGIAQGPIVGGAPGGVGCTAASCCGGVIGVQDDA